MSSRAELSLRRQEAQQYAPASVSIWNVALMTAPRTSGETEFARRANRSGPHPLNDLAFW
jgi:hypothetical protein